MTSGLETGGGRAVVVGGAQGIGFEIAAELARSAWVSSVIIADLSEADASYAASRLKEIDTPCSGAYVDVTRQVSIDQLAKTCGAVDYLAVSAGVFDSGDTLTFPQDRFERVVATNLIGNFYCAQRFARDMVTRNEGAIVGVASVAARMPRLMQAAYAASKAGMRQAYRVLGLELASRGVRVNTVSPGPTETEMMRRLASDHASVEDLASGSPAAFRPPIPRGRVGQPHDIATATTFLLSSAAAHITLTDLVVDGGELLGM